MQANPTAQGELGAKLVILPVAPKTSAALARRLDAYLKEHPGAVLEDVLRRLPDESALSADGRVVVVEHAAGLLDGLRQMAEHPPFALPAPPTEPQVAFVFSGQGSQWFGMGRELTEREPVFREALVACDQAILEHGGWSVLSELRASESELTRLDIVQGVLFALQVALANLWRSWGVIPAVVIGHSVGEVAAAHFAGALTLSDAAAVSCARSSLLRRLAGHGGMAFCALSLAAAEREILPFRASLSVAASNGPAATLISGSPDALRDLMSALERRGVYCQSIKVDVAAHSPQVEPLLDELEERLANIAARPTQTRFHSTATAEPVEGHQLDARYWAQNLRQPVRFWQAFDALLGKAPTFAIEVSPHPVLLDSMEDIAERAGVWMAAVPSLRRGVPERIAMLSGLATLFNNGYPVGQNPLFALDVARFGSE